MSFKLNFISNAPFALSNHAIIRISGPDAKLFLQSQCMNDVNALNAGTWQYNGWLNPQGRVMALFYLIARDETDYLMIVPELPAQNLVSALSRYVFRSKVTVKQDNDHHACGQLHESNESLSLGLDQTGPQIVLHHDGYRRVITVVSAPAAANAEALNSWHVLDMMNGWPWIGESQQGHWTPQMLSLQMLNAFSVKKGCYPGQEIVARTHFLGKNKRKLYFIQGLDLTEGEPILNAGNEIGKVINADFGKTAGLAVLPAEDLPTDLHNAAGCVRVENPEIC